MLLRAFILLLLFSPCRAQPLSLEFVVERTVVPVKGKASTHRYPLRVVLGTEVMQYDDGKQQVCYDFARSRIYTSAAKETDDVSLFAEVGGRWAEFQNRVFLAGALNAAHLKDAPMQDVVLTEHLFSLDDPKTKEVPKLEPGSIWRVTHRKKTLLEGSRTGFSLTTSQAPLYTRFLRYYLGGHPEALRQIQTRRQVPDKLTIRLYNVAEQRTIRLSLKKATPLSAEPVVPSGLHYMTSSTVAADRLLVSTRSVSDQRGHSLKVQQRAAALMDENKILAAALLYLGDALAMGSELPASFLGNKARIQADPLAASLFRNLSGDTEAASQQLKSLEKPAGEAVHVLYIFEAGVMTSRKKLLLAQALYLKALQKDPHIAGAWKDLGQLYFEQFDSGRAWRCWDTVRRLCPGHHMLEDVDELEKHVRKSCPDFF